MTKVPRSILITGCSTGIGFAAARALHARGWQVFATTRQEQDLARLQALGVAALPLDMAEPSQIDACAARVLAATDGRIGALFSNAAYGQLGAVEDLTPDVLRRQLEVNLIGLHDLTRRLIPAMRRQQAGRIVQCSSVLGLMAAPNRGAYCASKFALEALSDALRMELAGSGVHVSLIEPGPIRTRFVPNAVANFKRTIDIDNSVHRDDYRRRLIALEAGGKSTFKLEPEAVVARLLHAIENPRPKARYYVTLPTHVAALLKRVLPTRLLDRIARGQ